MASQAPGFAHVDGVSGIGSPADHWAPVDIGGDPAAVFGPPASTVETSDPGNLLTQILGTSYMTWKLAIFAAVLASISRACNNATGCLSSVQLVKFTNVQLIRCGIVSPIMRLATASAGAVSNVLPASGTASARIPVKVRLEAAGRDLRHVADVPRAVAKRALANDGALMMLLAKLLGFVYAAFLGVWFWATRIRWNGR
jgi:hypothetical protein